MRTNGIRLALAAGAAVLVGAPPATHAGNPDPVSRAEAVAETFGQQLVCEGGPRDGLPCVPFSGNDEESCENLAGTPGVADGTCIDIAPVCRRARGILTVVSDTVLSPAVGPNPFLETSPAVPCDGCEGGPGRSSMTLLLEFRREGRSHAFAEIYTGIPSNFVDISDPANPTQPGTPAWSSGGLESDLATDPETTPYKIRWGLLPPGVAPAVAAALGDAHRVPVVIASDEVPICTDAAACNNAGLPTARANHSDADDVLASVRRFKIDVGFLGACTP